MKIVMKMIIKNKLCKNTNKLFDKRKMTFLLMLMLIYKELNENINIYKIQCIL